MSAAPHPNVAGVSVRQFRLDHEVRLHEVRLDRCHPEWVGGLFECLSEPERERAARFRFAVDRARFIVGRGVLRQELARSTGMSPAQIPLVLSAAGRPELRGGQSFSISHSGDCVLIAFCSTALVGVDVEQIAPACPEGVAELVFGDCENAALRQQPDEAAQIALFYRLWTRKEALLKAVGRGFLLEPRSVCALGSRVAGSAIEPWTVRIASLDGQPDHAAAVAVASPHLAAQPVANRSSESPAPLAFARHDRVKLKVADDIFVRTACDGLEAPPSCARTNSMVLARADQVVD